MNPFSLRRPLPMVFQSQFNECGLACLAMVSGFHGRPLEMSELRSRFAPGVSGSSIRALLEAASAMALRGRALKLTERELDALDRPAILHWDGDHFVVLKRVHRRGIEIHDPAVGVRRYGRAELSQHFAGIAIELSRQRDTPALRSPRRRLQLRELLGARARLLTAAAQILFFSLLLQSLQLMAPLYLQLVIDQGLSRGDVELLFLLAALFGLLALARVLLDYARGVLTLNVTSRLGFAMVSETFRHLLGLPLAFFQRRELGDLVSRFSSLENIKQIVTQELITAVVDGLFSILTLGLLYLYQPLLATIVLLVGLLSALGRLLSLPLEKALRQETLVSEAAQHSRFMENVRRINTIRLNGIEAAREADWQDKYARFMHSSIRLGHLQLGMGACQSLLLAVENIVTIYLGAQFAFQGQMSLGQLMSFLFLKQHFISSVSTLLPKLAEVRLLRLDLERVAEIRSEPREQERSPSLFPSSSLIDELVVEQLRYSFDGQEPPLLDGLDFGLAPGSVCVLTGPSGCGKSTLLLLILGVLTPDAGGLKINGRAEPCLMRSPYADRLAVILHEDGLLSGDLAFNIHLGVAAQDFRRLREACARAGILDFVETLPLGFASRVGEMGSFLSAGQARRILLARAFFKRPALFILDETLIHLGSGLAGRIIDNIRATGARALIVSHDPEVIAAADQLIDLRARGRRQKSQQRSEDND